jgi:hypothetical protein
MTLKNVKIGHKSTFIQLKSSRNYETERLLEIGNK